MDDTDQRGSHRGRGTIHRMDNIAIVVDDLTAAKAFSAELGLELEGEATLEGRRWIASLGSRSPIGHRDDAHPRRPRTARADQVPHAVEPRR